MVDKEQQISESNQMYGQLQQQLVMMLDRIATETEEIKKLELQLNEGDSITYSCIISSQAYAVCRIHWISFLG